MKKTICSVLGLTCSLLSMGVNASLITNEINLLLPTSGTLHVDLDGDSINDLGLAEDCCSADNTWTSASDYTTQVSLNWLSLGDVIDDSLAWTGGNSYMDLGGQVIGSNYIAVQDFSLGDFFGYITLDYNGTDLYLSSFTYENNGSQLTVSNPVPSPAPLMLLGIGLLGFAFSRNKKAL
ncbi:PEP-CTERM sorting domain-containing protein [Psychromonas sp. MME2]|uniref:PEP-CTERM sorting domain-containing protein n=1 Tax=unclassified Psychromonas TaxID=2614957 RepID=UPI00339D20B3